MFSMGHMAIFNLIELSAMTMSDPKKKGVPKNPKTIEINVLLEFECLSTLLNPHVHQSLT
jgi:hypothetical protein